MDNVGAVRQVNVQLAREYSAPGYDTGWLYVRVGGIPFVKIPCSDFPADEPEAVTITNQLTTALQRAGLVDEEGCLRMNEYPPYPINAD